METDRDRIEQIARDEAWLRTYSTPPLSPAVLRSSKQAVRFELGASRLIRGPELPPEVLARVKRRVRDELRATSRVGASSWWRSIGLAAAACLTIIAGLVWHSPPASRTSAVAELDQDLGRFIDTLTEVMDESDVQLALLREDVRSLEGHVYQTPLLAGNSADVGLEGLGKEIDSLDDEAPLGLDELGDDV